MSITIDKDLCIGCGACLTLCPKIFKINQENKAEVISQEDLDCAKNAVESCPTQAIRIT